MKKLQKKLSLSQVTIRVLRDLDLAGQVVGGIGTATCNATVGCASVGCAAGSRQGADVC